MIALTACSRAPHPSSCDGGCGGGLDGRADTGPRPDTVYTGTCLGSGGMWSDCDAQPNPDPNAGVYTSSTTVDGTTCPKVITQTSGIQLCVLELSKISIAAGARVRLAGRYPIVLVSTSTIEIDGILDASASLDVASGGAGPGVGTGCTATGGYGNDSPSKLAGAGGGGSGGLIGLAAPIISAQPGARLFAVGGAGGGGAGDSTTTAPTKGGDGYGVGATGASGGTGGEGIGGNGGGGSYGSSLDGSVGQDGVLAGANTYGGGGGGGGASGWIELYPRPASFAATTAPPAS